MIRGFRDLLGLVGVWFSKQPIIVPPALPTPPERIYPVPREVRRHQIEGESRVYSVAEEDRTYRG